MLPTRALEIDMWHTEYLMFKCEAFFFFFAAFTTAHTIIGSACADDPTQQFTNLLMSVHRNAIHYDQCILLLARTNAAA